MERIALVTDSTCDIPVDQLTGLGVYLVPLSVFFGDREYLDNVELTPEKFYPLLASSPHFPTTSQPSPGKFLTLFQQLQQNEYTHVICLLLSRKLSGTHQSASVAAKMAGGLHITVLDSKTTSWGLGLLVLYAHALVKKGLPYSEILANLQEKIPAGSAYFTVETLDALQRGGRIGKAAAFLGKHLGVRPVLMLDGVSGEIEVVKKVHSHQAAVQALLEGVREHRRSKGMTFGACVVRAERPELQQELFAAVRALDLDGKEVLLGSIGAVVGTHLGRDGWGILLL